MEPDFDLAYVLPDFQSQLATQTDGDTKAEVEKLMVKIQGEITLRVKAFSFI